MAVHQLEEHAVRGYLVLIVGLLCNGTFCVPHKYCSVSNIIFTLYFAAGAFAISEFTLPLLLLLDRPVIFSLAGLGSGCTQYVTTHFVFYTVGKAGVAVSMVAFAGSVILASKLLEDLLIFQVAPSNVPIYVSSMATVVRC